MASPYSGTGNIVFEDEEVIQAARKQKEELNMFFREISLNDDKSIVLKQKET
jgi:hypothetical protein